jgi:hypothetical protein
MKWYENEDIAIPMGVGILFLCIGGALALVAWVVGVLT